MSSIKVTFVQADGSEQTIETEVGRSLMEVARENGVSGILADCGGGCACATCHVYVDEQWQETVGGPNEIEFEMLDMVSDLHKDNSRLSCQIKLTPEHDGLRVTVAPS